MHVNFSATPFKSTYKIGYDLSDGPNGIKNSYPVECFCRSNLVDYKQEYNHDSMGSGCDSDVIATGTAIARDWQDSDIEAFLNMRGVNFKKIDYAYLVGEDSIISRSVLPEYTPDSKLVLLDVQKFEKLANKNKYGNLDYCEEIYHKHFAKDAENIIKSGDEIEVPALHINVSRLGVENELLLYGDDAVQENSLSFYFNQTSDKPNQCLYHAMKNCGMTKIPVAVDEHSYKLGEALGLFV